MIEIKQKELQPQLADELIGAIPLTSATTAVLLEKLLDSVGNRTLAFDLDSTLLNNRPRNAVIMRAFGKHKNEAILTTAIPEHFQDWSASNAMKAIGLPTDSIAQLKDQYWGYWQERFFTSEYCEHDIVVPGAPEFVTAVKEAGGTVCYLTGRHEGMRVGTHASLTKLGFPIPGDENVHLLMKPDQDQSDDLFKVETLQNLESLGPVHAAFDNEPTHINSYRTAFPDAVCVHLLTDHSMRDVKLLDGIYSILDFIR